MQTYFACRCSEPKLIDKAKPEITETTRSIEFSSGRNQDIEVKITDQVGKKIQAQNRNANSGKNGNCS